MRELCTCFCSAYGDLFSSMALIAWHLCVDDVDPCGASAFVACLLDIFECLSLFI